MNTQLQDHINRYSRHIRTAELNSIPNCQTLPLEKKKEKDLRMDKFLCKKEVSVFLNHSQNSILILSLIYFYKKKKSNKEIFLSRLAYLFSLLQHVLQTFLICHMSSGPKDKQKKSITYNPFPF